MLAPTAKSSSASRKFCGNRRTRCYCRAEPSPRSDAEAALGDRAPTPSEDRMHHIPDRLQQFSGRMVEGGSSSSSSARETIPTTLLPKNDTGWLAGCEPLGPLLNSEWASLEPNSKNGPSNCAFFSQFVPPFWGQKNMNV